ncbi:MAG: hypothetical protein OEW09_15040, partial [Anaerolineae bacterium]|nr:hypothetical protein [Anaerolineae bacterium]
MELAMWAPAHWWVAQPLAWPVMMWGGSRRARQGRGQGLARHGDNQLLARANDIVFRDAVGLDQGV